MAPQDGPPDDSRRRDELLSALNSLHCRFVLLYFRDASEETASVERLSTAFARENGRDEDRAAIQLHHVTLPSLEAVGVVDYDARSRTARFYDHSSLDDLYSRLRETEADSLAELL